MSCRRAVGDEFVKPRWGGRRRAVEVGREAMSSSSCRQIRRCQAVVKFVVVELSSSSSLSLSSSSSSSWCRGGEGGVKFVKLKRSLLIYGPEVMTTETTQKSYSKDFLHSDAKKGPCTVKKIICFKMCSILILLNFSNPKPTKIIKILILICNKFLLEYSTFRTYPYLSCTMEGVL